MWAVRGVICILFYFFIYFLIFPFSVSCCVNSVDATELKKKKKKIICFFSPFPPHKVAFSADEANASVKEVLSPFQATSMHNVSRLTVNDPVLLMWVLPQCIEGVIGGLDYNQGKVNQWTASIVEHSLAHLVKHGRPFKYIGGSHFKVLL